MIPGAGEISAATSVGVEKGGGSDSGTWTVTGSSTGWRIQDDVPSRWKIRETQLLNRLAIVRTLNDLVEEDFSAAISDGTVRSGDIGEVDYRRWRVIPRPGLI